MAASSTELDSDDLDARIRRAEIDLVARDERVRLQVTALGQRLRRAREPARWVLPLAGGALAVATGWWLWRRFAPKPPQAAGAAEAAPPRAQRQAGDGDGHWHWLELLAMAWPLLPEPWRARWGPTSTAAMMNLGSMLVNRVFGARSGRKAPAGEAASQQAEGAQAEGGQGEGVSPPPTEAAPLNTVAHVDLARYAGTWYEIARLPTPDERACDGQPQATYTLGAAAGSQTEPVLEVVNRCLGADGHERVVHGEARAVPGGHGAKLQVSFLPACLRWLPIGWADYWVLYLDRDYSLALVGEPSRRSLWVLAREPQIPLETLQALAEMAREQGFPVDRLLVSQHVPAAPAPAEPAPV